MRIKTKNPILSIAVPVGAGVAVYLLADASESVRVILGLLTFAVFSVQGGVTDVRKSLEDDI